MLGINLSLKNQKNECFILNFKKGKSRVFWCFSEKDLPASAGDTGSIPCPGKISQAPEHPGPCTRTVEPVLQNPGAGTPESTCLSPCSRTRGATVMRSPHPSTRE